MDPNKMSLSTLYTNHDEFGTIYKIHDGRIVEEGNEEE